MTDRRDTVSTLTDHYQTTVPAKVRRQLALKKGDWIRYLTDPNGRVYIEAVRDDEEDPAIGPFLDLLEADIMARPDRLLDFDSDLRDRIEALVEGIEVDLDEPLFPEDE